MSRSPVTQKSGARRIQPRAGRPAAFAVRPPHAACRAPARAAHQASLPHTHGCPLRCRREVLGLMDAGLLSQRAPPGNRLADPVRVCHGPESGSGFEPPQVTSVRWGLRKDKPGFTQALPTVASATRCSPAVPGLVEGTHSCVNRCSSAWGVWLLACAHEDGWKAPKEGRSPLCQATGWGGTQGPRGRAWRLCLDFGLTSGLDSQTC